MCKRRVNPLVLLHFFVGKKYLPIVINRIHEKRERKRERRVREGERVREIVREGRTTRETERKRNFLCHGIVRE